MCAFKILKQRHNSSEISLDNVFIQRQQWNIIFKTSNANQIALLGCRVNQRLTLGIVKLCPIAIFPLCRALTLQYIGCIGVTFYTTDPWYCEAVVPFSQYFLFSGLTMVAFVWLLFLFWPLVLWNCFRNISSFAGLTMTQLAPICQHSSAFHSKREQQTNIAKLHNMVLSF